VKFRIRSVDQEPDDLPAQLPLRGRLLRKIAGPPRRPEYWLAELGAPVTFQKDGVTRTIRYLILAARWEGGSICPGANLPVNIWYVLDDALLGSKSFDTSQAEFVAIGTAKVKRSSLWTRLFGSARLIEPEQRG
jgi:hypothetical protein